ncbi:MAG: hypothetical protein WD077_08855 [Bacteroidia bacterium]
MEREEARQFAFRKPSNETEEPGRWKDKSTGKRQPDHWIDLKDIFQQFPYKTDYIGKSKDTVQAEFTSILTLAQPLISDSLFTWNNR